MLTEEMDLPKDSKILDVGCGTGLMGKMLSTDGYNQIVGVDASEKFVEASVATGFYTET